MNFTLECEQEVDGRWIAEVPEILESLHTEVPLLMQCQRLKS